MANISKNTLLKIADNLQEIADLLRKAATQEVGIGSDIPLTDVTTVRVTSACRRAGYDTLGDFVGKREIDILQIPDIGRKGVADIKKALANLGVTIPD